VSQLETDNEDLLEAAELQRGKLQRAEETLAREAEWLREHEAELQQLNEHEAELGERLEICLLRVLSSALPGTTPCFCDV